MSIVLVACDMMWRGESNVSRGTSERSLTRTLVLLHLFFCRLLLTCIFLSAFGLRYNSRLGKSSFEVCYVSNHNLL